MVILHIYGHRTIFSNLVEYVYRYHMEPLIYFYGWILVEICSFIFHTTQIECHDSDSVSG